MHNNTVLLLLKMDIRVVYIEKGVGGEGFTMKRFIKRVCGIVLAMCMLFTMAEPVPAMAETNEAPTFSVGVSSVAELQSRMSTLIARHDDTYWTKNGQPSYNYLDSKYYYGWQCKGFASYIFNELFCGGYIGAYDSEHYYLPNPGNAFLLGKAWNFSSTDTATVKGILQQGVIGDYIQVRRRRTDKVVGHSMILAGKDDNGIWIFDCNHLGTCDVDYYYQTYEEFAQKNKGMSLYRSTKYPAGSLDTTPPVLTNLRVYDACSTGYTVSVDVTDENGVAKVCFPTWTAYADQDDLPAGWENNPTYMGKQNGNTYGYRVSTSDHNYEVGTYITHIYAWDEAGNQSSAGTDATLTAADYGAVSNAFGDDFYAYVENNATGTVLTSSNYSFGNGDYQAVFYEYLADDSQIWHFKKNSDGSYCLMPKSNESLGLHVTGGNWVDGTNVILHSAKVNLSQSWFITKWDGLYYLRPACSFDCYLDVGYVSTANNVSAAIRTFNFGGGQGFNIVPYIDDIEPVIEFEYEDHRYHIYDTNMTWTEAQAFCEENNGHLVTINNAEEQHMLSLMLANAGKRNQYWIGGRFVNNDFQWVTGEPVNYTNWDYNEPNRSVVNGIIEDYVHMYNAPNPRVPNSQRFKWNDTVENNNFPTELDYFGLQNVGFIYESNQKVECQECNWDNGVITENPTCTTDGERVYACTVCGKTKTEIVEALQHLWDEGVVSEPATGSDDGVMLYTCMRDNCDAQKTERIPALGHEYDEGVVTLAPKCLTDGVRTYTCKNCENHTYTETIEALGHDYENTVVDPTCNEQGYTEHTCMREDCGYSFKDMYTEALQHLWDGGTVTEEATATEDGILTYACTRDNCNATMTETIPALGHEFDSGVVTLEPTCTTEGIRTYTCKNCENHAYTEVISALGHDCEDVVIDPTCTSLGYTIYQCQREKCDYSYVDSYVPALQHLWDAGVVTVPATGSQNGIMTYTCQREGCNSTKTETISALGHEFDEGHVIVEPTCTTEGIRVYTCKNCTNHTYTETMEALQHLYEENVTEATCTTQGYTTYSCTREKCGHSYVGNVQEALDHEWDEGTITTPATAFTDGVMTYTCVRKDCGATETEVIPAMGSCDGGDGCATGHFSDVPGSDYWAHDGIDYAVSHGLFNGTGDGSTFSPQMNMDRSMLVTVLWRYAGSPVSGTADFTDVQPDAWYAQAVAWAAEEHVVNGVGDGRFDPTGVVTREMLATILYRYAANQGIDTSATVDLSGYPDHEQVATWSNDAVCWAVEKGIISGAVVDGQTILNPQGYATREQVAVILMRFIENVLK